jgi:hypothetical protein
MLLPCGDTVNTHGKSGPCRSRSETPAYDAPCAGLPTTITRWHFRGCGWASSIAQYGITEYLHVCLTPLQSRRWKGELSVIRRDIFLSNLKTETEYVLRCHVHLNREMLRLPMSVRRRSWKDYYLRLNDLTKRLDEIEKVGRRASPLSMMLPCCNRES